MSEATPTPTPSPTNDDDETSKPRGDLQGPDLVEAPTRIIRAEADPDGTPGEDGGDSDDEQWNLAGARLDRYLVLQRIGRGGMGEVVLAYDPELDRRVAIKLLRRHGGDAEQAAGEQARLLREAQALAQLSHPNVVAVHDVGTVRGRVYVAMEYVEGATLDRWAMTPRPWQEIVATVRAAGEGLAAAHRHHIVHRDFKPGNVIVGDDGRVRVLDFGLARHVDGAPRPRSGEGSGPQYADPAASGEMEISAQIHDSISGSDFSLSGARPLTETGTVMGTPAYMAPEQFHGEPVDARTDQFALCIVLYEALYGHRPFAGRSSKELGRAVDRGAIRKPKDTRGVPHRVEALLRRGLAPDPDARYATTDALLAALDALTRPISARWLGFSAIAAATVVAAVVLSAGDPPCQGAAAHMAQTWADAQREAVDDAFSRTGLPYATDSAARVRPLLDQYAADWTTAHTQACEATRIRGEQSEALLDLRIRCLELRRTELDALVVRLTEADATVVEHAVQAVSRLPALDRCGDTEFLTAVVAPPEDPQVAAQVARAQAMLARARAQALSGGGDVSALAADVLQQARNLQYDPLLADAALLMGTELERGGKSEEAADVYAEGLRAAASANHGVAEAMLMAALAGNLGYYNNQPVVAKRLVTHARGVLARVGDPPVATGQLALHEGNIAMRSGDYDLAKTRYESVLAIAAQPQARLMQRLAALNNLAALSGMRFSYEDARDAGLEAVALMEASLGPDHPAVGIGLNNVGATQTRLGAVDEAARHLRRAETILSAAFPAGHPELAKTLHNYAHLLEETDDIERARQTYERALQMKQTTLGDRHPSTALTLNNLGSLQLDLGQLQAAQTQLQRAREIFDEALPDEHPYRALALTGLGQVALRRGDFAEAVALLTDAHQRRTDGGGKGSEMGEVRFSLAQAMVAGLTEGQDQDTTSRAAIALARQALHDYRSEGPAGAQTVAEIEQWLRRTHSDAPPGEAGR